MADAIKLKSKARNILDYHTVDISSFIQGFTVDEAQYQKDLDRFLRRFGKREETDRVSKGDTVVLACRSEHPRFHKEKITVPVGKGLFSRALEEQLIGTNVGQELSLSVEETPVTVVVHQCLHITLPDLTDENIASFGEEGVSNQKELRKYLIAKQVDAFLLEDENPDMASAYVWQEMAKRCSIERNPEEERFAQERANARIKEILADTENEWSEEELDPQSFLDIFLSELDLATVGEALMVKEGRSLTTDEYEAYIHKLSEAYPERTTEELRETHSVLEYAIEQYADFLAQEIDGYVASCFKDAFTKE